MRLAIQISILITPSRWPIAQDEFDYIGSTNRYVEQINAIHTYTIFMVDYDKYKVDHTTWSINS